MTWADNLLIGLTFHSFITEQMNILCLQHYYFLK